MSALPALAGRLRKVKTVDKLAFIHGLSIVNPAANAGGVTVYAADGALSRAWLLI